MLQLRVALTLQLVTVLEPRQLSVQPFLTAAETDHGMMIIPVVEEH